VFIQVSLFGEWMVVREWGRVGSPGQVRNVAFDNPGAAIVSMQALIRQKEKRGYFVLQPLPFLRPPSAS
jgi:predicted DNA-binding WGR domain protein